MTTKKKQAKSDIDELYTFREVVKPSFSTAGEIESAVARFYAEFSTPVARKLVALGYGPLGDKDPNFNREFRRRYYLTKEDLIEEFQALCDSEDVILRGDMKERMDTFFLDARWFLKNRADLHEGSIPSDKKKGD